MSLNGWLNVDKPAGLTSYGVIARIKKITGRCRIGHAGTLDPLATGVLPIALGQATRTVEYLHQLSKTYQADIELGTATDTYDAEGRITFTADASAVTLSQVAAALKGFSGSIEQIPPMYSALKLNGRPLYELARRGETAELKPRAVTIFRLDLLEFTSPVVRIEVECSGGTYIRSLAYDLGQALGVGAHLKKLRRTAYGCFNIGQAVALDELTDVGGVAAALLPLDHGLDLLPRLMLDAAMSASLSHGVVTPELRAQLAEGQAYRLYAAEGVLTAIADLTGPELRLKVFGAAQPGE
ncbi:MAG: tRNA pseudouridine(55) synthase TruB [Dehalogenimonas sp.]|uniref:tRNA pseudouridine synthase B n=1 Tax=Candidatus Dehalogenimonas loeffleri TaxID=3127115 RepID=A0ABZ2J2N0_9CHLR|nr:tRNA pseudouridine(55) synthase TruB [Dehalogenimonas sp.]